MARINIEEKWWSDPRRTLLSRLLKDPYLTEGVVVTAWRLAQEYWEKGMLVPGHIFVNLHGAYEMLQANMACLHENELPNSSKIPTPLQHISNTDPTGVQQLRTHSNTIQDAFVYVRGAREFLSWGLQMRQKRVAAGQKSAARPRDSRGRLLRRSTETQQITNTHPAPSNIVQLSGSGSGSVSSSESSSSSKFSLGDESPACRTVISQFDFESVYQDYPQRDGDQRKKKGLEICRKRITTPERFEDFKKAVSNYKVWALRTGKVGTEGVKQFATFANEVWEEYVNPLPYTNGSAAHSETQKRLGSYERLKKEYEAEAHAPGDSHES